MEDYDSVILCENSVKLCGKEEIIVFKPLLTS
jgi:hypothetical protein